MIAAQRAGRGREQSGRQPLLVGVEALPLDRPRERARGGIRNRLALVADAHAERLGPDEVARKREVDGDGVEERRALQGDERRVFRAPLAIPAPDAVGLDEPAQERVARRPDARVALARELHDAAGVERRHDRLAPGRAEHRAGRRHPRLDVPLRLGRRLAVPPVEAAVHSREAKLAGEPRLAGERLREARRRTDRDQRHRLLRRHRGVDQGLHAVLQDPPAVLREVEAAHPLGLRARLVVLLAPDPDRDVGAAGQLEDAGHELRALLGVAVVGHDQLEVELGAFSASTSAQVSSMSSPMSVSRMTGMRARRGRGQLAPPATAAARSEGSGASAGSPLCRSSQPSRDDQREPGDEQHEHGRDQPPRRGREHPRTPSTRRRPRPRRPSWRPGRGRTRSRSRPARTRSGSSSCRSTR